MYQIIDKPIEDLKVPKLPTEGLACLSQPFTDLPDLNPIKVQIHYDENQSYDSSSAQGVLVSKQIGVKVFLNTISPIFGFAPTKVRVFHGIHISETSVELEEIIAKGNSEMRLATYGITEDSYIFISQASDNDIRFIPNLRNIAKQIMGVANVEVRKTKEQLEMEE